MATEVTLISRQALDAYEEEVAMLTTRHNDAMTDVESRKPKPITFTKNESNAPFDFQDLFGNDIICMPGDYYNIDAAIILSTDEIESNSDWQAVE